MLSLVLVPLLALAGDRRELEGPLRCPSEGRLEPPWSTQELGGADVGAEWDQGLVIPAEARLVLPLPMHHGRVALRLRADNNDAYAVEVPTTTHGWREVGRFLPVEGRGLQNRESIDVDVGRTDVIAIRPVSGDGRYSIALVCLRGAQWPVPLFWMVAMGLGLTSLALRWLPSKRARQVLALWVRADAAVALALTLALLDPPIGALAIGPAAWLLERTRHRDQASNTVDRQHRL